MAYSFRLEIETLSLAVGKDNRVDNMNKSSVDTASLVQQMNHEKVTVLLPAIVYIAILMVSGLVGNLMVCFYYSFKTKPVPTSIFIVTLAVYDLIFCSVSMPTEIADIARFYTFENGPACKILRFINYTASIASALTLVTIAIDRFKHIHRPTRKQLTVRDAKKSCVIVAGASILLSWPIVIIYNTERVPVPNEFGLELKGYDCTFVKDKTYKPYVWTYNSILVLGFIVCTIILAVLYSIIAYTIKKHKNRLMKYQQDASHTSETQMSSSETDIKMDNMNAPDDGRKTSEKHETNDKLGTEKNTKCNAEKATSQSLDSKADVKAVSFDKTNETIRITVLMIAITLVFVISFLPYLSLIIWRSLKGIHEGELSDAGLVWFKIGSRSFLLNSSINPWIYGTFNSRFRLYYYNLLCCKGTK